MESLDGDPRFYTTSLFADDVDEVLADPPLRAGQPRRHLLWGHRGAGVPGPAPGPGPNDDAAQWNAPGRPGARALPRERATGARQRVRRVRTGLRVQAGLPAAPGRLGRAVALGERRTMGRARGPVTDRHRGRLRRELGRVRAARHCCSSPPPTLGSRCSSTPSAPPTTKSAAILAIAQAYPDTPARARATSRCSAISSGATRRGPATTPASSSARTASSTNRTGTTPSGGSPSARASPKPATPRRRRRRPTCPSSPSTARRTRKTRRPTWQSTAAVWPNSLALTVPGQGHDIDPTSARCVIPLIQSFIDQGAVTGLDTTCLAQLPPPAFDLTLPNN